MSPSRQTNLAARMGRWSADHWKTATFGWLGFVVVAFALGMAGSRSIDPNAAGPGESGRMDRILEAGFERPASESVLVQSASLATTTTTTVTANHTGVSGASSKMRNSSRPTNASAAISRSNQ